MTYYLFDNLEQMPPSWTLAVLAVSLPDARQYVKACWTSGKFSRKHTMGEVRANCGGITDAAAQIVHEELESDLASVTSL